MLARFPLLYVSKTPLIGFVIFFFYTRQKKSKYKLQQKLERVLAFLITKYDEESWSRSECELHLLNFLCIYFLSIKDNGKILKILPASIPFRERERERERQQEQASPKENKGNRMFPFLWGAIERIFAKGCTRDTSTTCYVKGN